MIPLGILAQVGKLYTSWTRTTAPATVPYHSVTYAPLTAGNWFMFGAGSGGIATTNYYYSTNGTSWTTGTMPASLIWGASATDGTTLVAYPNSGNVTSIYTTTNGTTWTARSIVGDSSPNASFVLRYINGRFWRVGRAQSWSSNGTTWTNMGFNGVDMAFSGLSHIRITGQQDVSRCTGDPTVSGNWSATITLPAAGSGNNYGTIAWSNGVWVAGIYGSTTTNYAYSTDDGLSWISGTLPVGLGAGDGATNGGTRIFAISGVFYYSVNNQVIYSTDGVNWNTISTGTGFTFNDRGFAESPTGEVLMVGVAGTRTGNVAQYLRGA